MGVSIAGLQLVLVNRFFIRTEAFLGGYFHSLIHCFDFCAQHHFVQSARHVIQWIFLQNDTWHSSRVSVVSARRCFPKELLSNRTSELGLCAEALMHIYNCIYRHSYMLVQKSMWQVIRAYSFTESCFLGFRVSMCSWTRYKSGSCLPQHVTRRELQSISKRFQVSVAALSRLAGVSQQIFNKFVNFFLT